MTARNPAPRLVLASASPNRRALLEQRLGLRMAVRPADVDETPRPGERAADLVRRLARAKAQAVALDDDEVALAADTVIDLDGRILGKPADADEARAMLLELSDREHGVHTGVAMRRGDDVVTLVDTSVVSIVELEPREVAAYVATGEPMGRAGAYAVQGLGGWFVAGIDGSETSVVGLPLGRLRELFDAVGVDLWALRVASRRH